MEQHTLRIINKCLNANVYSYLETSGGQSSNLYLNVFQFLIRHLWQLKSVVFLHWCLISVFSIDNLAIYGLKHPHSFFSFCYFLLVPSATEAVFLVVCDPSINEL